MLICPKIVFAASIAWAQDILRRIAWGRSDAFCASIMAIPRPFVDPKLVKGGFTGPFPKEKAKGQAPLP